MKPKVSIIIPVFNVESYIEKCLRSVVDQKNFQDFEVVIVDDGSEDKSIDLITDTVNLYRNIQLVHQKNSGLSEARNTGLKYARGEYISFIDSDDWIEPNMISAMYEKATQTDSEIAVCKTRKVFSDAPLKRITMPDGFEQETILSSEEVIRYYFEHKKILGYVTNKIYKAELFSQHNISFPKGRKYEDISTTFQLIWHSRRVVFLDAIFYNYLQRPDSITNQSDIGTWDLIENIYIIKNFLIEMRSWNKYQTDFYHFLINHIFVIYLQILRGKKNEMYYVLKTKINDELKNQNFWSIMPSGEIDTKNKIKYLLMKFEADYFLATLLRIKKWKSTVGNS